MASLNIWKIFVKPGKNLPENIQKIGTALKTRIKEIKDAKLLHLFRVTGENQLIAVTEGDVEPAIDDMYSTLEEGQVAEVTGVPVTTFVSFLTQCLKIDPSIATSVDWGVKENCGPLLWIDATVVYTGHSGKDLVMRWKEEDISYIEGKKGSTLSVDAFKVCGQRRVLMLMETTAEELDQFTFTLPMYVGNNQDMQVNSIAKRIKLIS